MADRTCRGCGVVITPHPRERNPKVWCSPGCRSASRRTKPTARPCAHCGSIFIGERPYSKYCSDLCGYRHRYHQRRTSTPTRPPRQCKGCGCQIVPHERERNPRLWCSAACHAKYQRRNASDGRRQAERERNRIRSRNKRMSPRMVEARRKLRRAARGTSGKNSTWAMGHCDGCGAAFTRMANGSIPRFCSEKCKRRAIHERRRARERDAYVEDVNRTAIFERDGWRCQLCHKKVDGSLPADHMMSATLDHIIPLASGGLHEAANCQLAHRICNSTKSDRPWGEQLRLVG